MDIKDFDKLPGDAFLRRDVAVQLTGGQSADTIARWTRAGKFPKPSVVGNCTLFRVGDLRDWLADPAAYAKRSLESLV